MRFQLIDRITELTLGESITADKNLALSEEYLADHFPTFPVMPGVLMLEAMTQASAWLIRATDDFSHSIVTLQEARNIKYGNFVEPGQRLTVTAEIISRDDRLTKLKTKGSTEFGTAVSARLVVERYNLSETDPLQADLDDQMCTWMRNLFAQLDKTKQVK